MLEGIPSRGRQTPQTFLPMPLPAPTPKPADPAAVALPLNAVAAIAAVAQSPVPAIPGGFAIDSEDGTYSADPAWAMRGVFRQHEQADDGPKTGIGAGYREPEAEEMPDNPQPVTVADVNGMAAISANASPQPSVAVAGNAAALGHAAPASHVLVPGASSGGLISRPGSQSSVGETAAIAPVTVQAALFALPPATETAAEAVTASPVETGSAPNHSITNYVSQFLDRIMDNKDRYSGISSEEKQGIRQRTVDMMQSLMVSHMLNGLAPQHDGREIAPASKSDAVSEMVSLTNRWYQEA